MRITIVQGAFLPVPPMMGGAVEKVWFALGKEFARRGHEVVHVSRKHPDLPDKEMIEGVRHIRVGGFDTPASLIALKGLDLVYSLRVLLALPDADILVTNTFWLPFLVRSKRFGKLYIHVGRYPKGQLRFYSHAGRLQTVSRHIKQAIIDEVPHLEKKVRCIPYPLPGTDPVNEFPANWHARQKWILYVGRIHPEKGIELLIEAAKLTFSEQFMDWKLVLVGSAESRYGGGGDHYLAHLKECSVPLQDRIEWVGPVFDADRLADFYRKAALFVYPSLAERGETFGLAPLEAMSHGCPALVSQLACFSDFIEDGVTGFVFDHRAEDPANVLARRLTALMNDRELLNKAAREALRKAREFQLNNVAGQYLDDFDSVITESNLLE